MVNSDGRETEDPPGQWGKVMYRVRTGTLPPDDPEVKEAYEDLQLYIQKHGYR